MNNSKCCNSTEQSLQFYSLSSAFTSQNRQNFRTTQLGDSQSASRLRPSMDSQRPLGALGWIAAKCCDTHRAVQTVKTYLNAKLQTFEDVSHCRLHISVAFGHSAQIPELLPSRPAKLLGFLYHLRRMSRIIILDQCASLLWPSRCSRFVSVWVFSMQMLRLHTFA